MNPIKNLKKKNQGTPPKKVPNLAIIGPKTITVNAGDSTYFPFTVQNTSNEGAENITISAELDGGASPITLDGSGSENIRGISPLVELEMWILE